MQHFGGRNADIFPAPARPPRAGCPWLCPRRANSRPVRLASGPAKPMEKVLLGVTEKHLKDTVVLSPRQHKCLRGKSCLTNFFSFYNELSHLVDLGKPADVIFVDFSQALDTASRSILLGKTLRPQLDQRIVCWLNSWLKAQAQRVMANGVTSGCWPATSGAAQGPIFGPLLFSVFINDSRAGLERVLSRRH